MVTAVEGRMELGWFSLIDQAETTPPDWTCPSEGNIPEFPAIEVTTRIIGPEAAAWVGREFALSDERDPKTGCFSAWLYTTGGYDSLNGCVVSVGDRVGARIAVRVAARGSASGCSIRVVGEFALVISKAAETEPGAAPDRINIGLAENGSTQRSD